MQKGLTSIKGGVYSFLMIIFVIPLLLFAITGCEYSNEPQQILIKSDTVTLRWDQPDLAGQIIINPILYYNLYYREYGQFVWVKIATIESDEKTEYVLYHSDFGNGKYEFAVDYVLSNGKTSMLHSSRDHTANPISGWIMHWIGSD